MHTDLTTSRSNRGESLAAVARAAGFRRVELVRITVRGRTVAAEATGVMHRYPRTVPISMSTARRLVAAGAPVRIDRPRATEGLSS